MIPFAQVSFDDLPVHVIAVGTIARREIFFHGDHAGRPCLHLTTILTSLSGTTITFTTCLPARNGCVLGSARASALQLLLRGSERHENAPADLSVHLENDFGGVFLGQLFVVDGPRLPEHRAGAARAAPTVPRPHTARRDRAAAPGPEGSGPARRRESLSSSAYSTFISSINPAMEVLKCQR